MDDRKLHSLLIILKYGSMSAAAEELNCTQSAVTQMMNSLENELGFEVLKRTNRGIVLTKSGEMIMPFIEEASSALSALLKEAHKISSDSIPVIRIGTHASISHAFMFDLISSYQEIHPYVKFEINIGSTSLGTDLKNNIIDMSIGNALYFEEFNSTPILEDNIFAVIPDSFETTREKYITREELNKFCILRSPINPVFNNNYQGNIFNATYENEIIINSEDDSFILEMVSAGKGVTILPALSLHNPPAGVHLKKLIPPIKRKIVIALPKKPSSDTQNFANYTIKFFNNLNSKEKRSDYSMTN
ncbi:LysR family transcriptional regulator [Peptococcus simiae]|uniref:LysR family transcriptional regulator n=1 Tax=Peptococcus simiae TaxID=1643805 RepID=UPI00397EF59C